MRRRTYLLGGGSVGATLVGGMQRTRETLPEVRSRLRQDDESPIKIRIVDTNAPVLGGDLLEVYVEVENTGESAVRPEIKFLVDGDRKFTVETTVEAGMTKSLDRFQHRTYPVRETTELTIRVETDAVADERAVEVQWVDKLTTGRTIPDEEIAVQPDMMVQFEVESHLLDKPDGEVHWFVDGDHEGVSMGPWQSAYYGHEGAAYWQHPFEAEGTTEVTAAIVSDAENYWASWEVEVTLNGPVAPTVDATRPEEESLELVRDEETELELDVTDRDGDLDRVVWWLGHADTILNVVNVRGAADTAPLSLDGGCHGCPIIAWVLDDANRVTTKSVWVIDEITKDETSDFQSLRDDKLDLAERIDEISASTFFEGKEWDGEQVDGEAEVAAHTMETLASQTESEVLSEERAADAVQRLLWAEDVTNRTLEGLGGVEPRSPEDEHYDLIGDTVSTGAEFLATFALHKTASSVVSSVPGVDGALETAAEGIGGMLLEESVEPAREAGEQFAEKTFGRIAAGDITGGEEVLNDLRTWAEAYANDFGRETWESGRSGKVNINDGEIVEGNPESNVNQTIDIEASLGFVNKVARNDAAEGTLRGTRDGAKSARDKGIEAVNTTFGRADLLMNDLDNLIGDVEFFDALVELIQFEQETPIWDRSAEDWIEYHRLRAKVFIEFARATIDFFHEMSAAAGGTLAIRHALDQHYTAVKGVMLGKPVKPYRSTANPF